MSQKKPLTLSTAKRKSRISAKLAKKSEIAAKKLDKDVAKLKVKEFRQGEVQSTASPDIVASKSWRLPSHTATQLVNTEESTEQKPDSQSATVDIDNRHVHVTAQSASSSTDSEKTLSEMPQQADETQTQNAPKFQDYGSSESTHLGQGPHFDDTQLPLVTLSQLPEIGHVKQQIEPAVLTVSMARTTLIQIVRPPIISTEQRTPLSIDEQATHQSIKEDAPVASISGKLHAHGGTVTPLQWTVAEHQGQFGRLDIDPTTGEWHYQLDNNALNTDALAEGEHQTEQFTITVSSPNGEQVNTAIIIDVEGSNDLPHILGSHLASINAADSLPAVTGQLHSIDPDHNDAASWAVLDGQGQYGQLSINPLTGQWQYQLNTHATATLALVSGQQVTETFTVTATDQSGHPVSQQVSIQVNGADNTAIIQGDMTGLVTEDTQALNGQLTVSGQLSIQDPDRDQAHFSADSLQGQFGYLTIDVNGHWIYSADNSLATVQSLKSGEHLTDTFTIHSADGTAQNITVTINGTDDKAEISGTTSASLTEDSDTYQGMLRADGNLTITDNDHGPHLFTATEQYGQFGTLIIDEFGHWTYTADNSQTAIQALKTGESITDTLVVQTQDGTRQTISITIHGTDDHSVIMGTSVMRVFEDKRLSQGLLHTDGQLWVSNPDTGRAGFAAEQLQGQFGILSINTHGHWTYTADNNNPSIQALKHGESLTETLFVQALDGTSQKIAILIKGADDKAIIGGTATATLIEDQSAQHGQLQAHGALTITDPDADQAQFTALTDVTGSAGYGHFSIDATGNWTYTVDNTLTAIQQLNTGDRLTDSLTISSADGTNHTLTVTITGSNDAPVVAHSLVTTTATEDTAFRFSIPAGTFADIDTGDTLILSTGSLPAWLHFDAATGTFSGTPANGDVGTQHITVTATDGSGAQVSTTFALNVANTNDAPTLNAIASVRVTEDSAQATGQFTATDPDTGDTLTYSIAQPVNGLTVNSDGSWSFEPAHASYQHLTAGQTQVLTIPVTVTDSAGATSTQDLVIKVNGTNDGAVIAGTDVGAVTEDQAAGGSHYLQATGTLSVTDVDAGEAVFQAGTSTGQFGELVLHSDGQWMYQADNANPAVQALKAGEQATESFTVTSKDGTAHSIVITITGTNDAPAVAHALTTTTATEDAAFSFGIPAGTFADIDTGDTLTLTSGSLPAWLNFDAATGTFSGTPTNGDVGTQHITVTATDGSGAWVSSTFDLVVSNTNDAPTLNPIASVRVTEDSAQATGHFTATDPDSGDSLTYSIAQPVDGLTVHADGSWSFDPAHASYQQLRAGQTQTLTIPVTVTDAAGATSTQDLVIKINGSNDGAVIAGTDVGTLTEDRVSGGGRQLQAAGTLTVADADAGEAVFQAGTSTGHYGNLLFHSDGQWMYQADNTQGAIQQLKAGQQATERFTVHSADGTAHTITITITGSNDAPVIAAQAQSVTEDGALLSGKMIATDIDSGDTQTFSIANAVDGFTLNADGSYSFDPGDAAYQHLAAGLTQDLLIPITVTDSAGASSTQSLQITVTGANDGPSVVAADAAHAADLSGTLEDTPHTYTQADLLRLVGATDLDGDSLDIRAVAVDATYGAFSKQANGDWLFTPAANAHHDDIPLTLTVSDGHATVTAYARLDISPVTDVATPTLSVQAEQHVIQFGDTGAPAIYTVGGIQHAGDLHDFAIEMTVVGGSQVAVQGHNGPTLVSYAIPGDLNAMYIWRPENLQFHIGGQNYDTGVDISHDTGSHRYGFVWNGAAGTFDVLRDGQVLKHLDNLPKGASLTGGGVMAFGNDQDSLGGGFQAGDAWHGQLFSTTMATGGVTAAEMTQHALRDLATGSDLILDVQAQGPRVVDMTGHHTMATSGPVTTPTTQVDTRIANPNPGALLHLQPQFGPPQDADDKVTAAVLKGFVAGTELSDGHGHQHTVSGPDDRVDITHWDQTGLTAQLPMGSHVGALLVLEVTTTGPGGNIATSSSAVQAVSLNSPADSTVTTDVTIQLDIAPTDSPALIAGQDTGSVTEDVGVTPADKLEARGTLTIQDHDPGQAVFVPQTDTLTQYGRFSIDEQGHWVYQAFNSHSDIQALSSGSTLTDLLQVRSPDGSQHTITVTINGSNDAPVLTAQAQAITEDGSQLTGQMVATDVDTGDTRTFSLANAVDGFTLNTDGSYSFDPSHASYQHLAAGQTQDVVIPITVTDSSGTASTQNLTVTVTGTNDAAVITGTDAGVVAEDGALRASGQLLVSDVDDGQASFNAQARVPGHYGVFSLAADGTWTYDLNNSDTDVQALTKGQSLSDSMVAKSVDGSSHTITVSIQGRDDGAVIAGVDTGRVTEDQNVIAGQLQTSGQLTLNDADAGHHQFTAMSHVAGHYGSFSIDANGAWTYTADNSQDAVQQLGRNDSLVERFHVTSDDGTQHTVLVTLQGSNDTPVIQAQTRSVTEDGAMLTGQMRASDTDIHDRLQFSTTAHIAGFTLASDGSYSFDPKASAYQNLGAGVAETLYIPVTVRDQFGAQHTRDLLITVTGTNDGAIIQGKDHGDVVEDLNPVNGQLRAQGHLGVTDVDASQSAFVVQTDVVGHFGRFSIDADGAWTYAVDNSSDRVQALREGAQAVEHFVVHSLDGTSHAVRVIVHGSNDAPVVTSTAQTAIEDGALLHGQLRVTDRDRGDKAHFQLDHPVAGFTLDSDGSYRFDPSDSAHQDLRQGQVMHLDIPVTVTDDAGAVVHHTISITLTGRNDAAVISGADRAALTEDSGLQNGLLQASGQLQVSDIDDGEAHFTAQNAVAGSRGLGHFSINAAGQWIYTVDNTQAAVQQLQSGDSLTERFTVYSADGSAHTVRVTIAGSNDAPVLTAQTQAVTEDGARLSGRMVATDVDAGDTLSFSLTNAVDGFTLNADGSYSFDPGNAAYQHLTAGQTQDVLIPITVTDSVGASSTQNLTITVTGSNDGAVITGHDFRELQEDVRVQPGNRLAVDGVLTITDPDAGEAHFIAQTDVLGSGGFGHFSINADGQWHYEADNSQSAIQSLRPGDPRLMDTLVVTSVDGTTHTLSVAIQGMDDAPVLTAQTQAVTEDGMLLTGQMVATDVDTSDTLTFSLANAVDGFTLNADGSYSFDPSHASYQHLAAGQTQDLIIPITVTDSAGATSTQNLTITLTGSNDGPQVTHGTSATAADLGTINEDTPRVFSEADLLRLVGASDVDDGAQLHIVAGSLTSAHGTFSGDAAHGYTFTPAANFSGQDVDLQFSVTDGTVSREAHAQLDITPVADAPDRLAGKPLITNFDSAGGTGGWRTNAGAQIRLEGSDAGGQGVVLIHGQNTGVLHQDLDTFAGQRLQVTFDLMLANGRPLSNLEVVWEGKVIATLGTSHQLHGRSHHVLDLVASGPGSRLEFRPADNVNYTTGVKLDNIGLTFVDVRAEREAISNHDAQLHLGKEFVLTDTDGSESLHYLIKGLPVGFTLSDGTHSVTVAQADQEIDTRGWLQDALRVQAPQDYAGAVDIQVTARSEESGNQQTADAPLLPMRLNFESADVLTVAEDTPKTFSAGKLLALAGLVAAPGQPLSLSDVQVDAALGHFSHNSDGSWTFTPAANVSADQVPLTLTVTGGAQPITAALSLVITPVADAPVGGLNFNTDFDHQAVGSDGWGFVDGAGMGWHTDYAKGIEVGQDKLYGGASSNQIVELVAGGGSNLYRVLPTTAGQALRFGFDLSARAGNTVAALEVVWEGQVIDTIKPGSAFGLVHHDYDLVATGANSRIELRATGGDGHAIIDNIAISPPPVVGLVNHAVSLDLGLAFQLVDTDGSETISYLIKGLPVGAMLSDGTHSVTVATAGQVIDTKGWQLDTLTLQAPRDFEGQLDFKVSAIAEEAATHETALSADQSVRLTFEHLETAEDTPRTFSEAELLQLAGLRSPAGQTYALSDVQVDPAFGQVTHNADGSWTFTPAANVSADQVALNLTVAGGAQSQQVALPLRISAVADAPVLADGLSTTDFNHQTVGSDGWAFVDGAGLGWHTSYGKGIEVGQDKLYGGASSNQIVELIANGASNIYRDIPSTAGQRLRFGFDLSARVGSSAAALEVVWEGKVIDTITPASGYAMVHHDYDLVATGANSRLELRATGSGDGRSLIDNLQIGPPPQLALVNHELHLKLDDYFHLVDLDGSESLSYLIKGLPVGFTLGDGTHSVTVTAADQVIDTTGWQQDALRIQSPKDFSGTLDLSISGRSEEGSNHQAATSAELPLRLSFERLATSEDTPLTLDESKLLALSGVVPGAGEHLSLSDVQVDAVFGQFSHNADGSWTFTPAANVNADQVPFTLTVSGGSQPISSTLQLSITPVNDAPVLGDATAAATEGGAVLHGQLSATDVDTGDTLHYSLAQAVDGFTLNADGSYSFDPGHAAYQHVVPGQTEQVVIPVTVTDAAGGSSTAHLSIALTGTNNGAVIAGRDYGSVMEDYQVTNGRLEFQGALTISDQDAGEAKFNPENAVGTTYGRYTIDQLGNWLYTADNSSDAIQKLKTGEHLTDSFTVHSADGTAHTITVTIQGQDDAPAFVPHAGPVRSDDMFEMIGHALSNSDPYLQYLSDMILNGRDPAPFDQAMVSIKNAGVALIGPDGHVEHQYLPRSIGTEVPIMDLINWHAKGAGYEVVFTDNTAPAVMVSAHNRYNPGGLSGHYPYTSLLLHPDEKASALYPVMHEVAAASGGAAVQGAVAMPPAVAPELFDGGHVVEDSGQLVTGFIEVKDADAGQSAMQPQTGTATHYGRFSIDANGDWVYQLDNSRPEVQLLVDGQTLTDIITVHSADGTTHEVNITIHGQNDGAVIAGTDSGTVVEDHHVTAAGTIVAKGQLTVTDADAGQAAFVAQNDIATQYGHFSLAADGHWTYTVDNSRADIQALQPGGTPGETADVSQALALTLAQSNEAGFKAVAEALAQGQAGALAGVLDLSIQGAAIVLSGPTGTQPVVFGMDGQGRSTIGVDELLSWLHQGKGYELHLQGMQSDVQVFVHNRGDAADLHALPQSAAGDLADPAGSARHLALSWHTAPLPAELGETVTVRSVDGTEHRINLSIFGTAENAVIAGVDTGSVTEDSHVTGAGMIQTHGKLSVQDPNAGQSAFSAVHQVAGQYGQLSLEADGQWTYTADNNSAALNALNKGQSALETFVVKSVDGTAHSINITVHGADEKPDLWPEIARNLQAQSGMDVRGYHFIAERVAAGDSDSLTDVVMNVFNGKPTVVDASGHVLHTFDRYSNFWGYYVPMNELADQLKAHPGAMLVLQGQVGGSASYYFHDAYDEMKLNFQGAYRYKPSDHPIGSLPIAGLPQPGGAAQANAAAQLGGADSGSVLADGDAQLQTQGHLTVLDADGGQAHFKAVGHLQGRYGHFSIDEQGSWHYQADGHQSSLQGLSAGQQLMDSVTVHSADGTAHQLNVHLFGGGAVEVIGMADVHTSFDSQAVAAAGYEFVNPGRWDWQSDRSGGVELGAERLYGGASGSSNQIVELVATAGHPDNLYRVVSTAPGESLHFAFDLGGRNNYAGATVEVLWEGQVIDTITAPDKAWGLSHHSYDLIATGTDSRLELRTQATDGNHRVILDNLELVSQRLSTVNQDLPLHVDRNYRLADPQPGEQLSLDVKGLPVGFTLSDGVHSATVATAGQVINTQGWDLPALVVRAPQDFTGALQIQLSAHAVDAAGHASAAAGEQVLRLGFERLSVTEDTAQTFSAARLLALSGPQLPLGESYTLTDVQVDPAFGHFSHNPDGSWTFTPAANVAAASVPLTLQLGGGAQPLSASLHLAITPVNDAPVLAAQSASASEDSAPLIGHLQASDPDAGDVLHFSTSAQVAGFSLQADGSYSFDPGHADYQSLAEGEHRDIRIPIVVTDAAGQQATQTLTLQLTGRNDAAVISGVDTGHVQVGGQAQVDGQLQVSDADAGQAGFQATQVAGSFGSLSIDAQGHWLYQLNSSDSFVQQLLPHSSLTDQLSVHSLDGTTHNIDVQISGPVAVQQPPIYQPPVQQAVVVQGHDAYANILAAVRAGGYQYQAIADALEHGDRAPMANVELAISGSHVQIVDAAGHVVQTYGPLGAEWAASVPMADLMLWHAQGHSIIVNNDSGMSSTHVWLHDAGDIHNLHINVAGSGFNGWVGEYSLGELSLSPAIAYPAPAPAASDEQDGEPIQIENLNEVIQNEDGMQFMSVVGVNASDDAVTGNNDRPLLLNTAKGDIGDLSELSLSSRHGNPLTTTDAHFAAQASPVDHYLQMLGLSPTTVNLSPSMPVELLPSLSSSDHFNDIDAPMHAIPEVNHFENPLLDNDKEQHKDRHFDLFDVTELHTNPNDDDLLHSALNDMHNQM
ncbi:VCBS domain-containing protein [Shewanella cutis]|uniref:Tandem-95 repeat protein n=1 Tax=Shewanella cutis TaxID=2766780 RepID=A0ABS9QX11_9GAMM|nr:VCBS domain-containing protein [Shewanella sp. PS-2]MCG9964887.1 tandem-95 repeat protein [Shewanella sp. PS-2]